MTILGAGSRRIAVLVGVLGVPALTALGIGALRGLFAEPWRDEFATALFASLGPRDLVAATSHVDAVLAPYYLLMHLVVPPFGVIGARGVSWVAFGATAAVVAGIGYRWWGAPAGLVGGLLVALNPAVLQFGTQARPTGLAVFLVVVAILSLDLAIEGRRWGWWLHALAATLAVSCQLFAALGVVLTVTLVLGRSRGLLLRWIGASVPAGMAAVLIALAARSQHGQIAWIPQPSLRFAASALAKVTGVAIPYAEWLRMGALLLLTIATVAVVLVAQRPVRRPVLFSALLAFVPGVLLFLVSHLVAPVFVDRYFGVAAVGAGLLGAAMLRTALRPGTRAWRCVVAVGVSVSLLAGVATLAHGLRHPPTASADRYAATAQALRDGAAPGDLIIVVQGYSQGGLAYGLAMTLQDATHAADLRTRLPSGAQPVVEIRRIASLEPWRTVPAAGSDRRPAAIWLFMRGEPSELVGLGLEPALARCLLSQTRVRPLLPGGTHLYRFASCATER